MIKKKPLFKRSYSCVGWDNNFASSSQLRSQLHFTIKESIIAALLCDGYANKDIAAQLNIEAATVKTHLINIFAKLEVKSQTQAVATIAHL